MKKLLALFLSYVMVFALFSSAAMLPSLAVGFAGGTGTAADPYQVSTPEQLSEVRNYGRKHFIQICDIDLGPATSEGGIYYNDGEGWVPISLSGTYDGGGYAVKNIMINRPAAVGAQGLFSSNGEDSSVKNLGIKGGSISGRNQVGGVAGCTEGAIINCYNTAAISGTSSVGGVAGFARKIENCYNTGTVSGTTSVGGVAGGARFLVQGCYNAGNVSGSISIGGVTGSPNLYASVNRNYNVGNVSGSSSVGGIVGSNNAKLLENCYNAGTIRGDKHVGGIVGYNAGRLSNLYNIGDVDSYETTSAVGGGIGTHDYSNPIHNCYTLDIGHVSLFSTILTVDQMKDNLSFTGFDFDTIWDISPTVNDGFPTLRNMPVKNTTTILYGDVNGDGDIDFMDAQLILQYDAGLITLTPEQLAAADVNKDGDVDFMDAQLISQYDAGLMTAFE